ncbi:MAG: prephenate dehydrogenase/arogenate dehydrogenase family protein [archaeon]
MRPKIKPKTIAIIGGRGGMGSMFADAFRKKGYTVLITGRKTALKSIDAAARADVVIVTVPIRSTEKVIAEIGPHMKKDTLLTDLTSIKVKPAKAMLKASGCEVIAGHPLFAPKPGFRDQRFILCPVRGKSYVSWYSTFLKSLGVTVITMTPKEHDKHMAIIQGITHLSNIAMGDSLRKLNYDLKGIDRLSSPVYAIKTHIIGRIIGQDASLYADIEIDNPSTKKTVRTFRDSVDRLARIVERGDKPAFERAFEKIKTYFGPFSKRSMKVTNDIIDGMSKRKGR